MKKISKLSKFIIFSIAILIIYTIIEFTFSTVTGQSHDTLTTCIYGFFGGEVVSCALIKIFNIRKGE